MFHRSWRRAAFALGILGLASGAAAQEVLNVAWSTNVGPLHPHGYGANQMFAQGMVYEGLVTYTVEGVTPALALSWDVAADGLTYTFKLRRDVTFSNGEPFDAAAVKANLDAVLAKADQHGWLDLVNQIAAVHVVDAATVQLVLRNPYYPLLQELALVRPVRFVAPSQLTAPTLSPIGTGPWMLVETAMGEYDLFARNPAYWGPAPGYDQVRVKVISDPNSRAVAFETGEIDLIYGAEGQIPPDTFARFRATGQYQTASSQPLLTRAIALNSSKGPTADLAVRQAINHAIDKDLLVSTVLHGTQPRADTLFATGLPYADVGLKPYAFDPARAEALLDGAGWMRDGDGPRSRNGMPLEVDFAFIGTDAQMKAMAEIVQADLGRIGIAVALRAEDESAFANSQTSGDFSMIFNDTWGAPYDPHAFVGSMRAPSHADYQAQLGLPDKPKLDADITAALVSTDEGLRQDLYRSILTTLHDQAIYVPVTYQTATLVAQPGIGGLGFGAMSTHIPFETFIPPAE